MINGPADQVQEFAALDANTRAQVISEYHAAGISLMMSAFGETEHPTTKGVDPVGKALEIANFVKQYGVRISSRLGTSTFDGLPARRSGCGL